MKDTVDPHYLRGFNNAYLLAQHKPKLLDCFLTTTTENEYLKGMRDGKYTYEQELKQNRTQGRLQQLNQQHSQGNRDQDHEQ